MKLQKIALSVLALIVCAGAYAQNKVTAVLLDESNGEAIGYATVSLTKKGQDKPAKYVLSNGEGEAVIESVRNGEYTFKAEQLGYLNYTKEIKVEGKSIDLGEIKMKVDAKQLDAASVSAVGNPIIIKKDTIEYNASSFKTTENDVLEDLLKKLPGIEVSEDGSITMNGETITKVYIDGKTFFMDDPQLASKNIPAKIVNKLKVIQKKSEQAEFTGIDDGEEETVIDLSVKPGMMKGMFGNIMAGAGHDIPSTSVEGDTRFQTAGFMGKFTDKTQLSIIINGNNTNNRGFNDLAGNMMGGMMGGGGMMGRGQGGWGGIVGLMRKQLPCRISNCLNAGDIQGFDLVGGIFGENEPPHVVTHCLNVGEIHAQSSGKWDPIGNVEGNSSFYLSKNYYKAMAYNPDAGGRIPVTAKEISDGSVAGLLNDGATSENALWHQTIGKDEYPVPDPSHEAVNPQKHDDVFVISSVEDLKALRTSVNNGTKSHYVVYISEDIDCSGITWEPIGTSTHPFSGICYGNGHTISNLNTADDKTKNGVGFFGVVDINTEVRDLFIGSGKIVGGNGVGAIIGYCDHKAETEGYVKIVGCGNAATIEGNYDCGGIVGAIYSDPNLQLILDNCYNMGEIKANEKSAALCGFAKEKVLVTSCWNSGKVTGYESNMGFARADASAKFEIHNCYNAESLSELLQTGVSSFTSDEAKDGTLCYNLNGGSNDTSVGLPWEQDITSEAEYPTYRGDGNGRCVYTSRNITNKYGTVVLPYTVKSNDYIRYYVLDNSEENTDETKVCFKAVDELPAGTPAIFRVKTTGTYDFVSSDYVYAYTLNETTKNDWTMTGNLTHESKEFTGTDLNTLYYISGGQLKQATKTLTISPFRAYLNGPVRGATTRALNIAFDDETEATGLRLVPLDTQNGTTTYGIFNLSGQRIDAPQSGINIVRSKNKKTVKFINK